MERGGAGPRGRVDSCFPCTHSPLPRWRRGVGLPGGPRSPILLPTPPPLPGAGGLCWSGRAGVGGLRHPTARPGRCPTACGTMSRIGGGWPAAPRLSPASAAVLLGVLCLPGAPASSLLTGTASRGLRWAHLRRVALRGKGGPRCYLEVWGR